MTSTLGPTSLCLQAESVQEAAEAGPDNLPEPGPHPHSPSSRPVPSHADSLDDCGDAAEGPSVEDLIQRGQEIRVPSDASLGHVLATLNRIGTAGGVSRPCCIAIEPGEHHCESALEIMVPNVTIRGLCPIDNIMDTVTCAAVVHGTWRLCQNSGPLAPLSQHLFPLSSSSICMSKIVFGTTHTRTLTHTHTHALTHAHARTRTQAHTDIRIYTHHTRIYTCMIIHTNMHAYIHTNIHVPKHT